MKLTDKEIIEALKDGKGLKLPTMSIGVFLKLDNNGKRLFIEDWGQDMGDFQPYLGALESDDWEVVDEDTTQD